MAETFEETQALETFVLDNPELAQLKALLDEFNIFEAIGAVRQEVRHSDFLAFLLNSQAYHGLDADFAQQVLLAAVGNSEEEGAVTAVDLALWDLSGLQVLREWQHIDILLLDEANRLAVIIENKVDNSEHSRQLQRYWRIVQQRYPGWRILGLFLTPDGDDPSDGRYLPIDYSQIYDLVTSLTQSRASTLGADVRTLMRHYAQMLRRHIMPDSDIAQLAQRIYKKHQRALDLIFEHRPDLQSEIADYLHEMVQETPGMILDHATKTAVRFCPKAWDSPVLRQGGGWTPTGRMLLFEFDNRSTRLRLRLHIGPGPQELRQKLYALVLAHPALFNASERGSSSVNKKWKAIYVQEILCAKDYEEVTIEDLTPKIQKSWTRLVEDVILGMTAVFQSAEWLWQKTDA